MAEFCPSCGNPISALTADDDSRLCSYCGWFGDPSEVFSMPPDTDSIDIRVRQAIALYRDTCRAELLVEGEYLQGRLTMTKLLQARAKVDQSNDMMLEMYRGLHE